MIARIANIRMLQNLPRRAGWEHAGNSAFTVNLKSAHKRPGGMFRWHKCRHHPVPDVAGHAGRQQRLAMRASAAAS